MTHRQRAGLSVIALVLVLVAVVASRQTHRVAGSAQTAPVPGPPAVGDCVLDALPGPGPGTTVTASSDGTVPAYPAQQIRPCTAARYGEIVSVIATPQPAVVKRDFDSTYLDDPNRDSCVAAAVQYVGMTTQLIQRFWRPFLQVTFALSNPSPRQEAAGQHWAACIVAPQPSDSATDTRSAQQYGRSIRDALHTGAQRDQLGSCTTTADRSNIFTIGGCQQLTHWNSWLLATAATTRSAVSRSRRAASS